MAGSFWVAGFPSIAVLVKQALNPTQTRELKDQVLGAWARRHEPAIVDRDGQLGIDRVVRRRIPAGRIDRRREH